MREKLKNFPQKENICVSYIFTPSACNNLAAEYKSIVLGLRISCVI